MCSSDLARLARYGSYVGVEPDLASAAVAASRLAHIDGAQFRMGGIERVGADEVFDLLCAFEVIEHIDDDLGALSEWARHLSDDGHVLISVPAHMRRFGTSDAAVGHFRRYDAIDLDRLFDSLGFEIVERRGYRGHGERNVPVQLAAQSRFRNLPPTMTAERPLG